MSGSTPPGTQWLQQQRRKRRRRPTQEQATQDKSDLEPTQQMQLIQQASDDEPSLGAWQFQVSPNGSGQYDVIGSSPNEADWGEALNDNPLSLNDALAAVQNYRTTAASMPGA